MARSVPNGPPSPRDCSPSGLLSSRAVEQATGVTITDKLHLVVGERSFLRIAGGWVELDA